MKIVERIFLFITVAVVTQFITDRLLFGGIFEKTDGPGFVRGMFTENGWGERYEADENIGILEKKCVYADEIQQYGKKFAEFLEREHPASFTPKSFFAEKSGDTVADCYKILFKQKDIDIKIEGPGWYYRSAHLVVRLWYEFALLVMRNLAAKDYVSWEEVSDYERKYGKVFELENRASFSRQNIFASGEGNENGHYGAPPLFGGDDIKSDTWFYWTMYLPARLWYKFETVGKKINSYCENLYRQNVDDLKAVKRQWNYWTTYLPANIWYKFDLLGNKSKEKRVNILQPGVICTNQTSTLSFSDGSLATINTLDVYFGKCEYKGSSSDNNLLKIEPPMSSLGGIGTLLLIYGICNLFVVCMLVIMR